MRNYESTMPARIANKALQAGELHENDREKYRKYCQGGDIRWKKYLVLQAKRRGLLLFAWRAY